MLLRVKHSEILANRSGSSNKNVFLIAEKTFVVPVVKENTTEKMVTSSKATKLVAVVRPTFVVNA